MISPTSFTREELDYLASLPEFGEVDNSECIAYQGKGWAPWGGTLDEQTDLMQGVYVHHTVDNIWYWRYGELLFRLGTRPKGGNCVQEAQDWLRAIKVELAL